MKTYKEKILLIIGIALIAAAFAGFITREKRYYYYGYNMQGEVIRQELTPHDYYYHNRNNPNIIIKTTFGYQWGVFILVLFIGMGVIVSLLRVKINTKELFDKLRIMKGRNIVGHSTKQPLNEDNRTNIIIPFDMQPTELHENQDNGNQETTISRFQNEVNKTTGEKCNDFNTDLSKKLSKDRRALFTFLVVIISSAIYVVVQLIYSNPLKSQSNNSEVAGRLSFLFLLPFILYAFGGLIALIPYLLKKNYKSTFYTSTILFSLLLTIPASIGIIQDHFENKNAQIEKKKTGTGFNIEQPASSQKYENIYYTIDYPMGWKVKNTTFEGYLHQVMFYNSDELNSNHIEISVGIFNNPSGDNLNLIEFSRKTRNSIESLLRTTTSITDTLLHNEMIGKNSTCGYRTSYKYNNLDILCRTYILNSNRYIALIMFSCVSAECKPSFYREIVGSMQLN